MPLINAISDSTWGSHESGPFYPYADIRKQAIDGGYLWDELVAAYVHDWKNRGIQKDDLMLSKKGHAPGKRQEMLLFSPLFSAHGASNIPEEAFFHLNLFVSQACNSLPLDPSAEGRAAAAAALAAFMNR
jgi:hypothetical protein